ARAESLPRQFLSVIFLVNLTCPSNCHIVFFNIVRNCGASCNKCISSQINWRNQITVATNEGVVANISMVLVLTIIINKDNTTANIDILTKGGISNVG